MPRFYRVLDDGDVEEINEFEGKNDQAYLVVDDKARIIWLWKGTNCPVRRKFIGSRAMTDMRKQIGFHYSVRVTEQGDEDNKFRLALEGKLPEAGPRTSVADSETEGPLYKGDEKEYEELVKSTGAESEPRTRSPLHDAVIGRKRVSQMGAPGMRPQATFLADPAMRGEIQEIAENKVVIEAVEEKQVQDAFDILRELGEPKGYERAMVIVGSKVFQEMQGMFKELDEPLEGIYLVKEYIPRLICENGRVRAVELLKRKEGEEAPPDELEQDLSDILDMFGIEIG